MRRAAILAAFLLLPSLAAAEDLMPQMVPPPSRDVTPPGVTPAPITSGPLIREPLPPPPPEKARWHRIFLPETKDAATFIARKREIHIANVTSVPADVGCKLADGSEWPCGDTALFALRRYLLGRAIECYFQEDGGTDPLTAPCRIGSADIGLWLVTWGWATPAKSASADYQKAAEAARCAQLGLWRGTPRDAACPAETKTN